MNRAACMLAVLLVFGAASWAAPSEPAGGRRNVILLIADDLGMQVGCYGDSKIRTPHIDALAARGTRFTEGFATVSSCSPSRAVILTGLYTHTNGQYGLAHAVHHAVTFENVKSLPARLK